MAGQGRGDGEPAGTEAFGVYPPSWLSAPHCPVGTGLGVGKWDVRNGSGRVCGNLVRGW